MNQSGDQMSKYENMDIFELAEELLKWGERDEWLYDFGYTKDYQLRRDCRYEIKLIKEEMKRTLNR